MVDGKDGSDKLERALKGRAATRYVLTLYVAGMTPRSRRAIANLKRLTDGLDDRYEIEVIDIYQHPDTVREEQLVVVPTLIKKLPIPLRRFIGDLSDEEVVLRGLDLEPRPS